MSVRTVAAEQFHMTWPDVVVLGIVMLAMVIILGLAMYFNSKD